MDRLYKLKEKNNARENKLTQTILSIVIFATAGAMSRLGAKPVFADIDPVIYNTRSKEIEKENY